MNDSTPAPDAVPGKDSRERNNRRERFRGRSILQQISMFEACKKCGRATISGGGLVGVRVQVVEGRRSAGFAGLSTCGRVWLCPVCNAKVMARRAVEIQMALAWAHRSGLLVLWGSLTTRHHKGTRLADQLRQQKTAWRYLVNSWGWRADNLTATVQHVHAAGCGDDCERKRDIVLRPEGVGRVGYIRAAELSDGVHGWHAHFHPMIFWRGDRASAEGASASYVPEWVAGVLEAGGDAQATAAGDDGNPQLLKVMEVDEAIAALAEYVTKAVYEGLSTAQQQAKKQAREELRPRDLQAAQELVWSQSKSGRGPVERTHTHWAILEACGSGDLDELARWWELEQATRGYRMIAWSRGLRAFAGVGVEKDDAEVAAEETGDEDDTVCLITPEGWRSMRDDADLCAEVLTTLEQDNGWHKLRLLLDLRGIAWVNPDGSAPAEGTTSVAFAAAGAEE